MKLTAADLFVIYENLSSSLNVIGPNIRTTKEARQKVMEKIESIIHQMSVEITVENEEKSQ